jgi:hypothetical protein
MRKCDSECGSRGPAQRPARGKIRPLGCRELRAPTWRDLNEPLGRPPAPAGSANRRVNQFHPPSCTGVSPPVQCRAAISGVSPSPTARSDSEYFLSSSALKSPKPNQRLSQTRSGNATAAPAGLISRRNGSRQLGRRGLARTSTIGSRYESAKD